MNKRTNSKSKIIMTVLLVVLIMSCTLMEFFHMNATTSDECWETLNEVADYTNYGLSTTFSGDVIALSNISNQISRLENIKDKQVIGMVKNTSAGVTHSPVRIYYPDGDVLTENGFVPKEAQVLDFSELITMGPMLKTIHNDPLFPGNRIIEHMMPVVKNDEVVAMISVVIDPDSMEVIIPTYGFGGNASFFVVDKNTGDIVFDTSDKFGDNIFEFNNVKASRGYSWESWLENIKLGKSDDIAITIDSVEEKQFIHSVKSFNEDWMLVVVADSKEIFARAYGLRTSFSIVLVFEFLTFLIYLIWLLRKTRKEIDSETEHGINLIKTLASDYELVIAANLSNDDAKIVRKSHHIRKIFKAVDFNVEDEVKFSNIMNLLANTFVHPEDKKKFLSNIMGDAFSEKVSSGNSLSFDFRAGVNGKYRHFTVKAVPNKDEKDNVVVLGFRDTEIDYRIKTEAEKEENRKIALLEEAKAFSVVAGLAENFSYIAHLNFVTWEVTTYRIDERFKKMLDSFDQNLSNHDAFVMFMQKTIYPEDFGKVLNEIKKENILKILIRDKQMEFECRLVFDGQIEYFKVKVVQDSKDPQSVIIGLLNIDAIVRSEKKQKEQEALIQKTELLRILSEDFESIYDVDLDTGRYTESIKNGTFEEPLLNTFQKDIDYFVTQSRVINTFVYSEDKRKVAEAMNRESIEKMLSTENSFSLDFRHIFGDRIVWYRLRVSKASEWNNERRILIGLINNDEKMKKEKENQEALEKALRMANSSNRAKTTFLNSMSHDIRTPMNAIIGFTGLAESHIDDKEKVQDYLKKINQSSEHLLSLINDVLDMSRIESGKVSLNEQEESLAEIIHALKNIVMADLSNKNLHFCIDSSSVVNEKVICDKLRLNQILLNILSNAIKYTDEGGEIILSVKQEKSEKEGCAAYVFTVKDNGMGMSESYVKTIFDPFTREKSATVSGIQGTGLGMSITKNLVEMMGGDISVKSQKNIGTEFVLALDLKLVGNDSTFPAVPELKNEKILLLSKDAGVIYGGKRVIKDIGAECDCFEEAESAYEAIEKSADSEKPYRIILSDWHVGNSDCRGNIEELLKCSKGKSSVIVLSVCDILGEESEVEVLDVDGHVNKPMFLSDIYNALKKNVSSDFEAQTEKEEDDDYSGKKVLLVEDNELNREIACELLKEMGVETDVVEDGCYAVEILEKSEINKYNLILMDIQMPIMDGYEATRRIRVMKDKKFADIPIVAMTANAFEEDKKNAFEAGMTDHLSKPIDVRKLKDILNTYL